MCEIISVLRRMMKLFKYSFAMKYKLILDSSRISHDSESEQWMSAGIGDPFSLFELRTEYFKSKVLLCFMPLL